MEATKKRQLKSGREYDRLFPSAEVDTKTIRRNANVSHTVSFIPTVVQETLHHTKQIAQLLKGKTIEETCSNIWHFVYQHINYKKDQQGYEEVRSPARTWHDRQQGVDCDCYSVFISSVLTNLDIPHTLRITKYHRDYFQHIYPIVSASPRPSPKEREIVIDCVADRFDYEVPYSEKKDYPMDLQYLNGFDDDSMGELGKIIKRNMAKNKKPVQTKTKKPPVLLKKSGPALLKQLSAKSAISPSPVSSASAVTPAAGNKKKKGVFKKVLNVVNKVNPATVLLRNGILAAMKLNIKNAAKRLRWSYLNPQQAASKNIDPVKFQKLVTTRQKLEKIFYGAGGNPANLKKAILGGKGNKDKAVNGLGMLPIMDVAYINEHIPLEQLLGPDIYYSENVDGMDGFQGLGELGEPVTLAAVGAAMGVIAGIVAALKQIGDIFKSKQKNSEDFDESKTDAPENNITVPANTSTTTAPIPAVATNPIIAANTASQNFDSAVATSEPGSMNTNNAVVKTTEQNSTVLMNKGEIISTENPEEKTTSNTNTKTSDNNLADKQSFWDKNKKWLIPVAFGLGGLTIIAIGYQLTQSSNRQNKSSPKGNSLSGTSQKRKRKNHHRKSNHHKEAVALL